MAPTATATPTDAADRRRRPRPTGRRGGTTERPELPEPLREGRPSPEAAERALVRKPQIGDTRPAPPAGAGGDRADEPADAGAKRGRGARRGGAAAGGGASRRRRRRRAGAGPTAASRKRKRTAACTPRGRTVGVEPAEDLAEQRRGRERNGRPVGRYLMCVQVRPTWPRSPCSRAAT